MRGGAVGSAVVGAGASLGAGIGGGCTPATSLGPLGSSAS
jgi:hypothetical protein